MGVEFDYWICILNRELCLSDTGFVNSVIFNMNLNDCVGLPISYSTLSTGIIYVLEFIEHPRSIIGVVLE